MTSELTDNVVIDERVIGRRHAARLIVKNAAQKSGQQLDRKARRRAEADVRRSMKRRKK